MNRDISEESKSRKLTFTSFAILVSLFFAATNFLNVYYFFLFFAFCTFLFTPGRKLKFDLSFFALCLFSVSKMVFDPASDSVFNVLVCFIFPVSYFIGYCFWGNNDPIDEHIRYTHGIIYIFAAGTLCHFLLNMLINAGASDIGRDTIDFWTRNVMSATGQASLACFSIAVVSAFFFSNCGKCKKLIAILVSALIVAYNFILAGRTIFALLLIALAFAFFFRARVYKKKILKSLFIILLVVILMFFAYSRDIFGIRTAFESSNFYNRFNGEYSQELDDDHRLEYKLYYIKHMADHPLGGGKTRAQLGHSAHDLYLDLYDEAGIFAFLGVVIYILASLRRWFRFAKFKELSFETRLLVSCVYLAINIQFWLEPITRGMPWLLAYYCLTDGLVSSLLHKIEIEKSLGRNKI